MADLNEFISSRAANWSNQIDVIQPLRVINKVVVYFLCPTSTILLLYMILTCSPFVAKSYKSILLTSTLIDILTSSLNLWCLTYVRVENTLTLYFLEGPVVFASLNIQWISLGLLTSVWAAESTILVVEFVFRLHIIKHRKAPNLCCLFFMIGLAVALPFGITGFVVVDCCVRTQMTGFNLTTSTSSYPVLISDAKNNQIAVVYLYYRRLVVMGSFLLCVIVAILSIRSMRQQTSTLSNKSKRMLNNFSTTLYLKNVIPTLTIFFPMAAKIAIAMVNIESWMLSELTTTFYCWLPFINSISSLFLITCYRKPLIRGIKKLFRVFKFNSNSVQVMTRISSTT